MYLSLAIMLLQNAMMHRTFAHFVGLRRGLCLDSANYGKMPLFDCSKAESELGIKWMPIKKTLQNMAARELELVRVQSLDLRPCVFAADTEAVGLRAGYCKVKQPGTDSAH